MIELERWELEYQCGMHDPYCRKRRTGRRGGARHGRRTTCARSACTAPAATLPGACEQAARATTASATGAANTAVDAGGLQLEVSTLEVGGAARTLGDATRAEAAASLEATPRASCLHVPVEVPKEAHNCVRPTADPVGHKLPIGATVRLHGVDVGTALMTWTIYGKPCAAVVGGSSLSGRVGTVCGEPVHADDCFGSPCVFVPVSWLSATGYGCVAGFLAPCLERLLGGGDACDWRARGPKAMAARAALERRLASLHAVPTASAALAQSAMDVATVPRALVAARVAPTSSLAAQAAMTCAPEPEPRGNAAHAAAAADEAAAAPDAAAVRVAAETMRADHGPCDKAAAPATCEKVAPEATTVRLPPVLVPWRQLVPKRQDSLEARALKAVWARPAVALDASLGDGWPAPQAAARLAMAQPHTKSATSRRARSDAPGDVRRVLA
jgi:hypothetical protein